MAMFLLLFVSLGVATATAIVIAMYLVMFPPDDSMKPAQIAVAEPSRK